MLNKDKLNRIKGILSAKEGTLVPKFLNPSGNLRTRYLIYSAWASNPMSEQLFNSLLPLVQLMWVDRATNSGIGQINVQPAPTQEELDSWNKQQSNTPDITLNSTVENPLNNSGSLWNTINGILTPSNSTSLSQLDSQGAGEKMTNILKTAAFTTPVSLSKVTTPTPKVETPKPETPKFTGNINEDIKDPLAVRESFLKQAQKSLDFIDPGKVQDLKVPLPQVPVIQSPTEQIKLQQHLAPISPTLILEQTGTLPKGFKKLFNNIKTGVDDVMDTAKEFANSKTGKTMGNIGSAVGTAADLASSVFIDKSKFAPDSFENSQAGQTYDAISNSLMAFAPYGTIAGGAMKAVKLVDGLLGSKSDSFSADLDVLDSLDGSYGGASLDIYDAASKAGKKYGLFSGGKKKANKAIAEARNKLNIMAGISKEAADRRASSTSALNRALAYNMNLSGGYDLRFMRAAKEGTKIKYFKDPFKVNLTDVNKFEVILSDIPEILKLGGTILDKLAEKSSYKFLVVLSDPNFTESFKLGGTIKDREIEVIETNTTLKSVIPEGALHKNKHHLNEVGIDDSELTKKGIPVVDNDGDLQAEIELNEIIFTLEVTKEIESRYKEFYEENTKSDRKDELAIEAGKLLWKEILYNTDDRTGLIDTLKLGGTIQKDPRKSVLKHLLGGIITQDDINQMVKQALLNILTK